ncbi:PSD1 and planctomycete cytochrome C domain-containing protein [Frigoriglobus tundricola]|uniref:PSD1 and planctomycete cytochrome C domain-containing protein n=1 Tax=Frigoriglobus tundricola TaxID=2774151 RepID=UPI001D06A129|nr:PSD1 and planctomycete cytochrome C domain-containing protein [Frigoriglobus tundricola]
MAVLLLAPSAAPANDEFFEKKIRPLLANKCLNCHGAPGTKVKGGLKLTSRAEMMAGGDAGTPAVKPGAPDESLLIKAVLYTDEALKMPPKGKLSDAEIADLTKWVKGGAKWPNETVKPAPEPKTNGPLFTPEQKAFWAFQPVKAPAPPVFRDDKAGGRIKNPIDAFVLAKLTEKGLAPAPPADRRTLIRRVTFDLTGLPPTPEEVDAYLKDDSATAFEKVVDRLLASPAYGERWGRHWLDVTRYADSNGLDENTAFGNAWRYRDYVIKSLNNDKPYDRFLKEQLAGDLLPADSDAARLDQLTATGFLTIGPKVLAEPDKQKMLLDIADEQLDTVGKAFMGLTLGCARCHDHKFDPLPTRDYYSLLAVFTSTRTMQNLNTVARAFERDPNGPEKPEVKADRAKLARLKKDVRKLENDFSKTPEKDKEKRAEIHTKAEAARAEIKTLEAALPPPLTILAVEDGSAAAYGTQGRNLYVQVRGTYTMPGVEAPPVFPRIIAGEEQKPFVPVKPNPADKPEANKIRFGALRERSGRLELANWLADPAHPLTARVMVNRVWQHHFGEGLVRTPDNFGRLGERPTHPELLDWLALQFTSPDAGGGAAWSLKRLHKLILLSATYQMSCTHDERAALADPDNRLLWRFNRRRLEAEAVRDSMLALAGTLDRTTGGSLLSSGNFDYVTNDQSGSTAKYDSLRRSIYLPVIRNNVFDFFQAFDFVEPHVSNGKRASTVIASQALFLLNNPFVTAQAKAFAEVVRRSGDDQEGVKAAYLRAFARPATDEEVSQAISFVQRYDLALTEKEPNATARRTKAWAAWCQVLFASSEFVYVN